MRDIEFRGKRCRDNKWAHGNFVLDDADEPFIHAESQKPGKCLFAVKPETVGQYTGLKDKNGIKIFDGDILGSGGKIIGHIVGGVRGYCYDVIYSKPSQESGTRWSLYSVVVEDYAGRVEVIGNIHDNPELLKT